MAHSITVGQTTVFNSAIVNAVRGAVNKVRVDNYQTPFFSPRDIGANIYSYLPGYMSMNVTGGFVLYTGTSTNATFFNDTYQVAEDLTVVRGNHQFGVGGNIQYWRGNYTSTSRANGNWIFDGSATGLGLADLLVGRVTSVEHGGLNRLMVNNLCLRPGHLAGIEQGHAQSRAPVGAVLRPERREQRDLDLQPRQLPPRRAELRVPQRPGRTHLSWRSRVPEGTDGAERSVVEPLAPRGSGVGHPR
jgi:hypothetical protein